MGPVARLATGRSHPHSRRDPAPSSPSGIRDTSPGLASSSLTISRSDTQATEVDRRCAAARLAVVLVEEEEHGGHDVPEQPRRRDALTGDGEDYSLLEVGNADAAPETVGDGRRLHLRRSSGRLRRLQPGGGVLNRSRGGLPKHMFLISAEYQAGQLLAACIGGPAQSAIWQGHRRRTPSLGMPLHGIRRRLDLPGQGWYLPAHWCQPTSTASWPNGAGLWVIS